MTEICVLLAQIEKVYGDGATRIASVWCTVKPTMVSEKNAREKGATSMDRATSYGKTIDNRFAKRDERAHRKARERDYNFRFYGVKK